MKWWSKGATTGQLTARRAREAAEKRLAAVRRRQPEVDALVDALDEHRRRNHFAERIEQSMRGHA